MEVPGCKQNGPEHRYLLGETTVKESSTNDNTCVADTAGKDVVSRTVLFFFQISFSFTDRHTLTLTHTHRHTNCNENITPPQNRGRVKKNLKTTVRFYSLMLST